jgi:GNAT superfamily N-acetyltransferase
VSTCLCASRFQTRIIRPHEHKQFKRVVDLAHFPSFLGPTVIQRSAVNGGAYFYEYGGQPAGASLVNPHLNVFLVLAVLPAHRKHGLGEAIIEYVRPNFARVITDFVPYFRRNGYEPIGTPHKGRKYFTQVMVRRELLQLAGRASKLLRDRCRCLEHAGLPAEHDGPCEEQQGSHAPVIEPGQRPARARVAPVVLDAQ